MCIFTQENNKKQRNEKKKRNIIHYPLKGYDKCKLNPCRANATCKSIQASYKCACQAGYSGNGIECYSRIKLLFNIVH